MAKMYGQLPSYVRDNATVYDLLVTDTLLSWENEQYNKASNNGKAPRAQPTEEEMKAMLAKVKEKYKK